MPKMWHNVGLTLLVFVATLLIVLLLMVCGEWASPRGGYTLRCTRRLDWSCRPAGFVWLKKKKKKACWASVLEPSFVHLPLESELGEMYPRPMAGPLAS